MNIILIMEIDKMHIKLYALTFSIRNMRTVEYNSTIGDYAVYGCGK